MANKIIPKKSSVVGKQPMTSDLQIGEIAINLADKLIFTKDANGTIVTLGGGGDGGSSLPSQTGNAGKYLTTDGSTASWGSIDLSAYLTTSTAASTYQTLAGMSSYLTTSAAASAYQPKDADLTAIAALAGTSGLLKKTAADTWTLDTNAYLTANQTITVSGDASGSGSTSIALTLATVATAGTYKSVTVDAKGRVTSGTNPTTLSGYGITDAQPLDADLTAIAALTGTSGFLKTNGSGTWSVDTATYLTTASASSTYLPLMGGTMTGDVTFSGTSRRVLADLSNNTVGSRLMFQDSTANNPSGVGVIPNGTATTATWQAYNSSTPDNSSTILVGVTATESTIRADKLGTGSYLPLTVYTGGAKRFQFGTVGQLGLGTTADYGTSGQVLTSGGPNAAPTWTTVSAGGSYLPLTGGTLTGGLTFNGTGIRIFGDFSNATLSSRMIFQTSTTNGATSIFAMPNGTNDTAAWTVFNTADPANAGLAQIRITSGEAAVAVGANGTGTQLPLALYTNSLKRFQIGTAGQWGIGATPDYGTAGYFFKSGGPSAAPTWGALATSDLPTTLQANTYAPGATGSTSAAVTAAGTTQATATALTSDVNIITTSTAGTGLGVVMMGATSGKYAVVVNRSANAINLYPASGHTFDGQAVNTPISIPANGFIEMFGSSTTQWHTTYQAVTQGSFVIGAVSSATTASTANALNTANNYQVNSLGVGTAGSGTAGEIRATNNITAYYTSDARFKTNVEEIEGALDIVDAIGGKLFDWTDAYIASRGGEDGYFIQKADFGVIAQDVQKNFPRGVRVKPDGTLAVDYEKMCALAFAAINELRREIRGVNA